jgi:glutathione synthase
VEHAGAPVAVQRLDDHLATETAQELPQLLDAVLRVPPSHEARANLYAGGHAERTALTPRDRRICAEVGARCRVEGLLLVGVDVIGGHLTEINVTSPGGLRSIERVEGRDLAPAVVAWIEDAVAGVEIALPLAT